MKVSAKLNLILWKDEPGKSYEEKREKVTNVRKEAQNITAFPTEVKKMNQIYNFMPINLKIKIKIPRKMQHTLNIFSPMAIKEIRSKILNLSTKNSRPRWFISEFFRIFREDKTPTEREGTFPNSLWGQHELSAETWQRC